MRALAVFAALSALGIPVCVAAPPGYPPPPSRTEDYLRLQLFPGYQAPRRMPPAEAHAIWRGYLGRHGGDQGGTEFSGASGNSNGASPPPGGGGGHGGNGGGQ